MLGETGFNEMDMALLKHLLFNKKPVAFVRTQCDQAISGIMDEYEEEHEEDMDFKDALVRLRKMFSNYISSLNVAGMDQMGKLEHIEFWFIFD